jgi:hypothetical protein
MLERSHQSDPRDFVWTQPCQARPAERDGTCCRRQDARDEVNDGALSRTVRADEALDDAGRHREAHIVYGLNAAEVLPRRVDHERCAGVS